MPVQPDENETLDRLARRALAASGNVAQGVQAADRPDSDAMMATLGREAMGAMDAPACPELQAKQRTDSAV